MPRPTYRRSPAATTTRILVTLIVLLIMAVPLATVRGLAQTAPEATSTAAVTVIPTDVPTYVPTDVPSVVPTYVPTDVPSVVPTHLPTDVPSVVPSFVPTDVPSVVPTYIPTDVPSVVPTYLPTDVPTVTIVPGTVVPTDVPTYVSTDVPTVVGSVVPTVTVVGSATPTPTPRRTLSLDRDESRYNETVRATLSGFTPRARVALFWPRPFSVLATGTADRRGLVQLTFQTPSAPLGTYVVTAVDATGAYATDTVRVIPRLRVSPDQGGPNTRVTVSLHGFAAGERVEVRGHAGATAASPYEALTTVRVRSDGSGSAVVTVPRGAAPGAHLVVARGVASGASDSTTFQLTTRRAGADLTPSLAATSRPHTYRRRPQPLA